MLLPYNCDFFALIPSPVFTQSLNLLKIRLNSINSLENESLYKSTLLLAWVPEDGAVRPDGADHLPVVGERHGPLQPGRHLGEQAHQGVGPAALVIHLAQQTVILRLQNDFIEIIYKQCFIQGLVVEITKMVGRH